MKEYQCMICGKHYLSDESKCPRCEHKSCQIELDMTDNLSQDTSKCESTFNSNIGSDDNGER